MAATPELSAPDTREAQSGAAHARALLDSLGRCEQPELPPEHPAETAARCGLMALTGAAHEPPRVCPAPLAACAEGALAALAALPGGEGLAGIDGAALLGERAALAGLQRAGSVSAGGACRMLRVADGWLAVQLARPDDWALLPAWLEQEPIDDWSALAAALAGRPSTALLARAALLGLAVAEVGPPRSGVPWCRRLQRGMPRADRGARAPLVLDLSSLWAGPLCSHLLQRMGARVIKLESEQRPDGARDGNAAFFDLMHAGKASVALDLSGQRGREQLSALIARADIVIEAARPRALRQFGIEAEQCVAEVPGLSWISLTGYGRDNEAANRVAYGDDAGVAAGLNWLTGLDGDPVFVGDAVADPLTGLHAALCAWAGWLSGEGGLWSLALTDVVSACIDRAGIDTPEAWRVRADDWRRHLAAQDISVQPPRARPVTQHAAALGADTREQLLALGVPC